MNHGGAIAGKKHEVRVRNPLPHNLLADRCRVGSLGERITRAQRKRGCWFAHRCITGACAANCRLRQQMSRFRPQSRRSVRAAIIEEVVTRLDPARRPRMGFWVVEQAEIGRHSCLATSAITLPD